jgi:hypothetical protein
MKPYNKFFDKYGNKYEFVTYEEFSKFWFNLPRHYAVNAFQENFSKLNRCATSSKEARQK